MPRRPRRHYAVPEYLAPCRPGYIVRPSSDEDSQDYGQADDRNGSSGRGRGKRRNISQSLSKTGRRPR